MVAFIFSGAGEAMRRLLQFVVNNVREHLMVYIVLWSVIAVIDLIYVIWAEWNIDNYWHYFKEG